MAKYSSKTVTISKPVSEIRDKFSDFRFLEKALDNLPADERAKVGELSFEENAVVIKTPQVGEVTLKAIERTPEKVVLQAEGAPAPMKLEIDFKEETASSTGITGIVDVEIPAMLKPLVGPMMQKAADQFGEIFAKLA